MTSPTQIGLPRRMLVGGGAIGQIGELVASLGLARPLVVTDSFLVGTGAGRHSHQGYGIGGRDNAAAGKLVESLDVLCREVQVPTPQSFGIDRNRWDELMPVMVEQALTSGSPANNPRVPTADEIAELYRQVYA